MAGDARRNITFATLFFPIAHDVVFAIFVYSATFPFSFMLDDCMNKYAYINYAILILIIWCARQSEEFEYLGLGEYHVSEDGPVVDGNKFHKMSAVREVEWTSFEQYGDKVANKVEHCGYLYFSITETRDVPFRNGNGSCWFDEVVRMKTKIFK